MDRQFVYVGAIPLETDLLSTNKNSMIGLAKLASAILGNSTTITGFAVTPTGPASLLVNVAAGETYSLQNIDATAYSSLAADTAHQILKQGISLDQTVLTCAAPTTAGQSINYLIQIAYQESDALPVVLPYYNASNPAQAYAGPNNSGATNNTVRKGVAIITAKAGISAVTGSQTTPSADSGNVGAYVVVVAFGQTQITAPNISLYASAPFINSTLHGLSPVFGASPLMPTPTANDSSLLGANTQFVQTALNLMPSDGVRATLFYGSPTSGSATGTAAFIGQKNYSMSGFRFRGNWTKVRSANFANPDTAISSVRLGSGRLDITAPANDLGCELTPHINQWYAIFAVANAGGAIVYKLMPFFRAKSIAGNVITLNFAGEDSQGTLGGYAAVGAYYDWQPPTVAGTPDFPGYNFTAANNMAGADVLVINETNGGRKNQFSGRLTTVASNTNTTITLTSAGTMGVTDINSNYNGDWFLVAPPGYTYYKYLGSFLWEPGGSGYISPTYTAGGIIATGKFGGGDMRNISDSGGVVKMRAGNMVDPTFSAAGTIASPVYIRCGGVAPPLATSIILQESCILATASIGTHNATFYSDSIHDIEQFYCNKSSTSTETPNSQSITIPFSFSQDFYISITGSLDASRSSGKLQPRGWIEA